MQSLTNKKMSESYRSILIQDEATGKIFKGDGTPLPVIAESRTKIPYSNVPNNIVFGNVNIAMEVHNDSPTRLGSMAFGYGITILERSNATGGIVTNNPNPVGCHARLVRGHLGIAKLRTDNPAEYANYRTYIVDDMTVDATGVRYSLQAVDNIDGGNAVTLFSTYQPNATSAASGSRHTASIGNSAGGNLTIWGSESIFSGAADGTINLGSASRRWKSIFASDGAIQTSDRDKKTEVEVISEDVILAWMSVDIIQYKWIKRIEEKGDAARIHIGILAQRIHECFADKGLDAFEYGLLCYDEWDAKPAVLNEEGNVVETAREAGSSWGVRMDECLWLEALAHRYRGEKLEARLEALELAMSKSS